MLKTIQSLNEEDEYYSNDYEEGKQFAKDRQLIESEYGDTCYNNISYVCYNRSGRQDDTPVLTVYYTWQCINNRLKPMELSEDLFNRCVNY